MSFRSLESAVLRAAKVAFKNPKLRLKDIREWSTGIIEPTHPDEVVVNADGFSICVFKQFDRRKPQDEVK